MFEAMTTAAHLQAQVTGTTDESVSQFKMSNLFSCDSQLRTLQDEDEECPCVPEDLVQSCKLRLCVYSAELLTAEETYVEATIGTGEHAQLKTGECAPGGPTNNPYWRWTFEVDVNFNGLAESVELRVFGKRFLRQAALLGSASIMLTPLMISHGPQRKLMVLRPPAADPHLPSCSTHSCGKLVIAWELSLCCDFTVPLRLVAEMGSDAMDVRCWKIDVKMCAITLKKKHDRKIRARLELQIPARGEGAGHFEDKVSDYQEGTFQDKVCFFSWEGWEPGQWKFSATQAAMMGYILRIVVLAEVPAGQEEHLVGRWTEPIGELWQSVQNLSETLHFDADITLGHESVGMVRVEFDIFSGFQHRQKVDKPDLQRSMTLNTKQMSSVSQSKTVTELEAARHFPVRKGLPLRISWQNPVTYEVVCYADGLRVPDGRSCTPVVRIVLGEHNAISQIESGASKVCWKTPITMRAVLIDRTATVTIYDAAVTDPKTEKQIICQATMHDVYPGAHYWLHCYGGAVGAKHADVATKMARGLLKPASTYRGTVVVFFGQLKKPMPNYFFDLDAQRKSVSLVVRLDKGCGFQSLRGQRVKVLVQLAGCRLPDYRAALARGSAQQQQTSETEPETADGFNFNLLSIPGAVDQEGVLRFNSADGPFSVRSTPPEIPLALMPGVNTAYFYVVAEGQESSPPKLFGAVPLSPYSMCKLAWHEMHFDPSVADLAVKSDFQTNFAGLILGSARIEKLDPITAQGSESPDIGPYATEEMLPPAGSWCCGSYSPAMVGSPGVPKVMSSGVLKKKTMYCHIDMLAARSLPPNDDGHCSVGYAINIGGRNYSEPGDGTQSMNPSLMHRIVIPVEIETYEDDGTVDTRLPPIVVKISDMSHASTGLGFWSSDEGKLISCILLQDVLIWKDEAGTALDLNQKHQAVWYALDSRGKRVKFASLMHHKDSSWDSRPRLLLAAAWSESDQIKDSPESDRTKVQDGYKLSIKTPSQSVYQMEVDILGLRNLPASLHFPQLSITSFWTQGKGGPIGLKFDAGDLNPNFTSGQLPAGWENFAQKAKSVLVLTDDMTKNGAKVAQSGVSDDLGVEGSSVEKQSAPKLFLSTLVGARIRAPLYTVPVVPYLNPKESTSGTSEPFVLMPNLTFTLEERYLGHEYGLVSVPVRQLRSLGGGPFPLDWAEVCVAELDNAGPDALANTKTLSSAQGKHGAYEVCLDVFAPKSGWLMFDRDVRIASPLTDNDLFSMSKEKPPTRGDGSESKVNASNLGRGESLIHFNCRDFMLSDPRGIAQPFPARCTPLLVCRERSQEQHKRPTDPSRLFEAYFNYRVLFRDATNIGNAIISKDGLTTCTSSVMIQGLAKNAWRCLTHLAAPEPEPERIAISDGYVPMRDKAVDESLTHNKHVFIRPVGHIISNSDRDSRIVARLRMVPRKLPAKSRQNEEEPSVSVEEASDIETTRHFVFFKFKHPGVVIWVAPESVEVFSQPGMPIVAVRLCDGSNEVVLVRIPSFDLRFPSEQFWYPSKTLRKRLHTVKKRLAVQKAAVHAKHEAAKYGMNKGGKWSEELDAKLLDENERRIIMENDLKLEAHTETQLPDGYTAPIYVRENGFVMRLKKCDTGAAYDRCTTANWYRTVLEGTFPEIKKLKIEGEHELEKDILKVRDHAMARLMNMRIPMDVQDPSAEAGHTTCLVKGHVTCRKLTDFEATDPDHEVQSGIVPLERLWQDDSVQVSINLLTGHGLKDFVDSQMRVVVKLGNKTLTKDLTPFISKHGSVEVANIYCQLDLEAHIPGASELDIEIWSVPRLLSPVLLGVARVDIEDRWMLLKQRSLREQTQQDFLKQAVWPLKTCEFPEVVHDRTGFVTSTLIEGLPLGVTREWKAAELRQEGVPEGQQVDRIEPSRPPSDRAPLELLQLTRGVAETAEVVGQIRAWVDLLPYGDVPDTLPPTVAGVDYELRVKLHDVKNVQVFRDSERNDLYIQLHFKCQDMLGKAFHRTVVTDCHRFAVHRGSFNKQWIFKFQAPVSTCVLEFTVMDMDTLTDPDQVYFPVEYSLAELVRNAVLTEQTGHLMGMVSEFITFNQWKGMNNTPGCWTRLVKRCFGCWYPKQRAKEDMYAELKVEFECVSAAAAEVRDAEQGAFLDGHTFLPPEERLGWRAALDNPSGMVVMILGPTVAKRMCFACKSLLPFACCILLLLAIVLLVYFSLHIAGMIRSAQAP